MRSPQYISACISQKKKHDFRDLVCRVATTTSRSSCRFELALGRNSLRNSAFQADSVFSSSCSCSASSMTTATALAEPAAFQLETRCFLAAGCFAEPHSLSFCFPLSDASFPFLLLAASFPWLAAPLLLCCCCLSCLFGGIWRREEEGGEIEVSATTRHQCCGIAASTRNRKESLGEKDWEEPRGFRDLARIGGQKGKAEDG